MIRDRLEFVIDDIIETVGKKDNLPYVRFTLRIGIDEEYSGDEDSRFAVALYGCLATRTLGDGEETWFAPQSRGFFRWVPNVQIDVRTHKLVREKLKELGIYKKIPQRPYIIKKGEKTKIKEEKEFLREKLVTEPGRTSREKEKRKAPKAKPSRREPSTFDLLLNLKGANYSE